MRTFDHVGIPIAQNQLEEMYVGQTKVWVTDPLRHPQRIEYLRFEPDSPVTGPVRELPHMAFRVDHLEREIEGAEVLLGPFHATDTLLCFPRSCVIPWRTSPTACKFPSILRLP